MDRPTGLTAIAILAAAAGFAGLVAALSFTTAGSREVPNPMPSSLAGVAGLILLVTALLSLALAFGAWTLMPWAWPLGVAVALLDILNAGLQYLNGQNLVPLLVSLAVAGVLLWLIVQPDVREALGRRSPAP